MSIVIETNVAEFTATLRHMADSIPAAAKRGVQKVTAMLANAERVALEEIEAAPIPTSGSGRPLWEHQGILQDDLRTEVLGVGDVVTGIVGYEDSHGAEFARRRHQLGEPSTEYGEGWTPANPAGDVVRHNPFAREPMEAIMPEIGEVFAEGFGEVLGILE